MIRFIYEKDPTVEAKVVEQLHVVRKNYWADDKGGQCSIILENTDKLLLMVPESLHPIVTCLKAFRDVIKACFGMHLEPDFAEAIDAFTAAFMTIKDAFGISITSKVHIVMVHVKEYILATGLPLGLSSKEVVET